MDTDTVTKLHRETPSPTHRVKHSERQEIQALKHKHREPNNRHSEDQTHNLTQTHKNTHTQSNTYFHTKM